MYTERADMAAVSCGRRQSRRWELRDMKTDLASTPAAAAAADDDDDDDDDDGDGNAEGERE